MLGHEDIQSVGLDLDELEDITGAVWELPVDRPIKGTTRPSDYATEQMAPETGTGVDKCAWCGRIEPSGRYTRGLCHLCYSKWQYQHNKANIRASQKRYKERKRREQK